MIRVRVSEHTLARLYAEQEMRTPTHFSVGQEAIAVGVCAALSKRDVVFSGHRSHAQFLAKGGSLTALVGELYGKKTGAARGRGGSVHLAQPDVGYLASSAILGQTVAAAVGAALAFSMDSEERVAVCFFGDGAVDEGIFHESLNFAAVRKLPVLFICENNLYSTHTPLSTRLPQGTRIHERAFALGVRASSIDGNDVFAVHDAASAGRTACLGGNGPEFIECATYRWLEHVGPDEDWDSGYRSKAELEEWKRRDPLSSAEATLLDEGSCTASDLEAWRDEAAIEIGQAVAAAKVAPFPDPSELFEDVY